MLMHWSYIFLALTHPFIDNAPPPKKKKIDIVDMLHIMINPRIITNSTDNKRHMVESLILPSETGSKWVI